MSLKRLFQRAHLLGQKKEQQDHLLLSLFMTQNGLLVVPKDENSTLYQLRMFLGEAHSLINNKIQALENAEAMMQIQMQLKAKENGNQTKTENPS